MTHDDKIMFEWSLEGFKSLFSRIFGVPRRPPLVSFPRGYYDIFAVAELPANHPKAYIERNSRAIRPTEEQGFLCYGQYRKNLPTVPLQALYSLWIDDNSRDDRRIVIIDMYDHSIDRLLGKRLITRKDFEKAGSFCLFRFDFTPPSRESNMEFRIYYMGSGYIRANKIAVIDPAKISVTDASQIPNV